MFLTIFFARKVVYITFFCEYCIKLCYVKTYCHEWLHASMDDGHKTLEINLQRIKITKFTIYESKIIISISPCGYFLAD